MSKSRKNESFLLSGCDFFHVFEQLDPQLTTEHAQHASEVFYF